MDKSANKITSNKTFIGIEFGSTRIKSVLIDDDFEVLASGSFQWENKLTEGYWSYAHDDILAGLRKSYASLKDDVKSRYGITLTSTGCIGISAMMHGYLAFDAKDNLLVPFRTWRNVTATEAAEKLGKAMNVHIPERWSIAHLYQAALDHEPHLDKLCTINTLAGYIHYRLSGNRVLGVGDASGMFPILNSDYDFAAMETTEKLFREEGYSFDLANVLPRVLTAGESGGALTEAGALLLDPSGDLKSGIPLCPPEGDAGTGMVATNSVRISTGNVSAGTSIFAMIVLDKNLTTFHREIDTVTTPDGSPVAMIHCNNCSGDIDAWFSLLRDAIETVTDKPVSTDELYAKLLKKGCEKTNSPIPVSFNYLSGESITEVPVGAPFIMRKGDDTLELPTFIKSLLYSSVATLRLGADTLTRENVKIKSIVAHGGFCKSEAGIRALSASLGIPVKTFVTAGEGGAYGMAILAAYSVMKGEKSLPDFLDEDEKVYASAETKEITATEDEKNDFDSYLEKYKKFIDVERKAGTLL